VGDQHWQKPYTSERNDGSHLLELDLRYFDGNFIDFFPDGRSARSGLKVGQNLSLLIKNIEDNNEECLELISAQKQSLWSNNPGQASNSLILLCVSDRELARSWQEIADASIIEVPALDKERKADFAPLIQRFAQEAARLSGDKIKRPDADIVAWLSGLDWPENIKQLKTIIIDSLLSSTKDTQELRSIIEERLALCQRSIVESHHDSPDPFIALSALEAFDFNYRITAARIGCSVQQLKEMERMAR